MDSLHHGILDSGLRTELPERQEDGGSAEEVFLIDQAQAMAEADDT